MTTDIGLDTLTDDQIIELARALASEMASRDPSVADAAKQAIADAAALTTAGQDAQWRIKKWLALMVTTHIGAGYTLNVWRARDRDEARVYLEKQGRRSRDTIKICLYVTGNRFKPPGTIDSSSSDADSGLARLIMQHAFETHPGGVTIECDRAAATAYTVPAEPQDVADYVAEKRAREAHAARRDTYRETVRRAEMADHDAQMRAALEAAGVRYGHELAAKNKSENDRLHAIWLAAMDRINAAMRQWDLENKGPAQ